MTHSKPAFPSDLEREICEIAARMYPGTIPALLRVAQRILIWIEPLLYRVVRTSPGSSYDGMTAALSCAMQLKPASFFRDGVRQLFLDTLAHWPPNVALELLRLCTGLVNFAPTGQFCNPALLPILEGMHLRRLSASLENLFGGREAVDLHHPLFSSLTHLNIFGTIKESPRIYEHLQSLPSLTHLCLDNDIPRDALCAVLSGCPHLEVVVNLWAYFRANRAVGVSKNPPVTDLRFVVGLYREYWDDWEAGARGGHDFWARAETFIERKRRGEISGTAHSYFRRFACLTWTTASCYLFEEN
ncbi:hypothetical protein C8R44DRAFT_875666 [Mycena epipterygia]|nr:hypothetical protein C8R44DRAFT_875666 [Mycena epipterygia]